jgi:N-methylhydantoinase B
MPARARPDPIRLEVFGQLLASVCEEAGALLQRSAASVNIRERRDYSCALFDRKGRLVAQAAHIPVHLGSAADSVRAVRETLELKRDDTAVLNDPYQGGTHLPDVTMVRPVFVGRGRQPDFFVVNRAHHADIGGSAPGSMAIAADLHGEGIVIPPILLRRRGRLAGDLLRFLLANVRGARERRLDLQAQEASLRLAQVRLQALVAEHGQAVIETYAGHAMDHAERIARRVVARIPRGTFRATDVLEDDGAGSGPLPIRLALRASRRGLRFDFRDSAPQARGGVNCNRSIVLAACVYVLRCLCPPRLPTNDGLFRVVETVTEPGSLLDPVPPAPVAGGNVETSQRLVDVCLQALRRAVPWLPACSAGTMSNLSLGGEGFQFYETLPGGAGAGAADGVSAVQTHMTNTRNTSIEELERSGAVRVRELTVRRGSGGRGRRRGGDGIVKEIEVVVPLHASLLAERHRIGPPGANGGKPGQPGRAVLQSGRRRRVVVSKGTWRLMPGERLRIETPGGGGFGR